MAGVVVFSNNETVISCSPEMILLRSARDTEEGPPRTEGVDEFRSDQGSYVGHLDACAALGGFGHLQGLQARCHVHAEVFWLDGVQLLFLAFMMLGKVT